MPAERSDSSHVPELLDGKGARERGARDQARAEVPGRGETRLVPERAAKAPVLEIPLKRIARALVTCLAVHPAPQRKLGRSDPHAEEERLIVSILDRKVGPEDGMASGQRDARLRG